MCRPISLLRGSISPLGAGGVRLRAAACPGHAGLRGQPLGRIQACRLGCVLVPAVHWLQHFAGWRRQLWMSWAYVYFFFPPPPSLLCKMLRAFIMAKSSQLSVGSARASLGAAVLLS